MTNGRWNDFLDGMRSAAVLVVLSLVAACSSFSSTNSDNPQSADAGADSAAVPPGAPPSEDGGTLDAADDANEVQPGDLILLRGDDIVADSNGGTNVVSWPNALDTTLQAVPVKQSAPPTVVPVTLASGAPSSCAGWADGIAPLAMQLGTDYALGSNDYSITVVAKRATPLSSLDDGRVAVSIVERVASSMDWKGIALMTEYQDAQRTMSSKAYRFGARATFLSGQSIEAVETVPSDTTNFHVITAYRRGTELRVRVDTTVYGPTDVTTAPVPANQPLVLGNVYLDDLATTFAGTLCYVVVHRGAETDLQIAARTALLRKKYNL